MEAGGSAGVLPGDQRGHSGSEDQGRRPSYSVTPRIITSARRRRATEWHLAILIGAGRVNSTDCAVIVGERVDCLHSFPQGRAVLPAAMVRPPPSVGHSGLPKQGYKALRGSGMRLGRPNERCDQNRGNRRRLLARLALRFTNFAEKWFPDAFVFVAIGVVMVTLAALANGATPTRRRRRSSAMDTGASSPSRCRWR